MFCFQCQETLKNHGCNFNQGMCGKKAATANLMDTLIAKLKTLALLHESQPQDLRARGVFTVQALFMTITNVNFDDARIEKAIAAADKMLNGFTANVGVGVLATENEDVRSQRELLIYGVKGIAAYADHAAMLEKFDDDIFAFIFKALAATTKNLSADELTALVIECGHCAAKTMALLDAANTGKYGNPVMTKVKTGVGKRPAILVSGHDLRDLHELLEQTINAGVDIYTHSEMLAAHYYPELKKYPHLIGNYGGSWWHQDREFAAFNGAILMTTNCLIPVKDAYRGRLFTTGLVGYPDIPHIAERVDNHPKDFSAIIKLAKTLPSPTELENGEIVGGFAHHQVLALADKVVAAVKSGAIKRFIVMAGCDGRQPARAYFTEVAEKLPADTIILTAGCAKYRYNKLPLGEIGGIPRVLDAGQCNDSYSLAVIALKLKEVFVLDDVNKLPLSFDIAWYEQKAVAVLLALLALGFKHIRIGTTLPAFLSPNVINVLIKTFDLKGITNPTDDVAAMLAGR